MTQSQYKEDLQYLFQALLKHPLLIREPVKREDFSRRYSDLAESCMDQVSFLTAASDLTMFFGDGHTNMELPYETSDFCLPISCRWQGDVLATTARFDDLPAGSKILGIEGQPVLFVLQMMSCRIPHENIELVKSRMTSYPYKNYHVFSQMNLQWMFGKKDFYRVDLLIGEDVCSEYLSLEQYNGFLDFSGDQDFISCSVWGSAAYLRLDACICNSEYEKTLDALAARCENEGVTSLTLDLSRNMGGSSAVIDKFLEYVQTDSYRRYEMIDYTTGTAVLRSSRDEVVKNKKKDVCFPAELYCIVSQDTFSSARTFAVILKDNGLAKIIGSPTGGKPSSYGFPRRDAMPHSKIRFRVSQALFLRPDAPGDDEGSLIPDILL